MTEFERSAIEALIHNDYTSGSGYFGEDVVLCPVWDFAVHDKMACAPNQRGGVIASLVKKGWVLESEYEPTVYTLMLTREGYEAAVANGISFDV